MADEIVDIKALDTRVVYENQWMRVREDSIQRRDGSNGIYGVVEKVDFAVVVPLTDDGCLYLVEQFRYPVGARYWELPQGAWEETPDTDPLEVAKGELWEETGLKADDIIYVGHLFQAYGYSTQGYNIFLAKGLRQTEFERPAEEQDLVASSFLLSAVDDMIRDGRIKDATTIAALGIVRLKGLL